VSWYEYVDTIYRQSLNPTVMKMSLSTIVEWMVGNF